MGLRIILLLLQLFLSPRGQRLQVLIILNELALGVPADDGSLIGILLLVLDDILHIIVQLLLGADIMHILHYLVGLYVELGHVQRQLLLLAEEAQLQVLLDVVLEQPRHWMPEEVAPFNAFERVDDQHLADDVLDVGVRLVREDHLFLLDAFEQVDDVGGSEGHSN